MGRCLGVKLGNGYGSIWEQIDRVFLMIDLPVVTQLLIFGAFFFRNINACNPFRFSTPDQKFSELH